MPTDIKLDQQGGDWLLLEGSVLKTTAADLMLDSPGRRRGGTSPHRRALVHDAQDGLTINFAGDYRGGVNVSPATSRSPAISPSPARRSARPSRACRRRSHRSNERSARPAPASTRSKTPSQPSWSWWARRSFRRGGPGPRSRKATTWESVPVRRAARVGGAIRDRSAEPEFRPRGRHQHHACRQAPSSCGAAPSSSGSTWKADAYPISILRRLRAGPASDARPVVTGLPLARRNCRTERVSAADRTTTVVEIQPGLCRVFRTSTLKMYCVAGASVRSVVNVPL